MSPARRTGTSAPGTSTGNLGTREPRTAKPIIHIDHPRDERLAAYAGVREPRWLRDQGLLIAEGRFVVRRLVEDGRVRFRSLLLNDAAFASLRDVVDALDETVDVFVSPAHVIADVAGFNIHRGCLAVAERPAPQPMDALIAASRFVVALERVVDADNVGSVFRNAEAFGVDAVFLSPGCCDPLYRKAIRTSSGATLMVPFATADPWPDALDRLAAAGFTILAMTTDANAVRLGDVVSRAIAMQPVAVLLGTEGHGLTEAAQSRSHVSVHIPISPSLDSLNIATAAGITLHRLQEVRLSAVAGESPSHSDLTFGNRPRRIP